MPDASLRRAADAGHAAQSRGAGGAGARACCGIRRSHALAENFGGQWLQFRALESVTRDRARFPDFEDYLRLSMRRETELFVEHVIREDRSILDFIDGRYTFVNERLARHYGIPDVSGPEFRRVDLTGTPRGGVVTQGSVLTVSSYATRTSPVLRGKWILDNLLERAAAGAAGRRPQPRRNRTSAPRRRCGCSSRSTARTRPAPRATGAWTRSASAWRILTPSAPGAQWTASCRSIRPARCPTAARSTVPRSCGTILAADRAGFSRALTSKLLTYALGRGLERYDTKTVKAIADRLPAQQYRFSALVLEIVKSLPFQSRRPSREMDTRMTTTAHGGTAADVAKR